MTNYLVDAIAAFFSTTLDDLIALMYLFVMHAKVSPTEYPYIRIIVGQFLGFTIIVSISLLGILLGTEIPDDYIALIGFIPLIIGLYKMYTSIQEDFYPEKSSNEENESTPLVTIENPLQSSQDKESNSIDKESSSMDKESNGVDKESNISNSNTEIKDPVIDSVTHIEKDASENIFIATIQPYLKYGLDPLILESTLFALLCGTDNIAIYISLFAAESVSKDIYIIVLFYVLLMINVFIALIIVTSPPVIAFFEAYAKYVTSVLLIALGIDILSGSILWP